MSELELKKKVGRPKGVKKLTIQRWAANPSAVSKEGSGVAGIWAFSQSRTSCRNCDWAVV